MGKNNLGKLVSRMTALLVTNCFGGEEDSSLWIGIQRQEWHMLAAYFIVLVLGAYAIVLIIERLLLFNKASRQTRQFQSKTGEAFFRGQFTSIAHVAREYPASPLAFVINAALNEGGDADERRPVMRLRQQAIVAKTTELKRCLWHLSAIGSALELLVVLLLCLDVINVERMIWYDKPYLAQFLASQFVYSLNFIVFSFVVGYVVLVANKFLTAKVEQFQLEMDRLSLAFIERITSRSTVFVTPLNSYSTGIVAAKKTGELLARRAAVSE